MSGGGLVLFFLLLISGGRFHLVRITLLLIFKNLIKIQKRQNQCQNVAFIDHFEEKLNLEQKKWSCIVPKRGGFFFFFGERMIACVCVYASGHVHVCALYVFVCKYMLARHINLCVHVNIYTLLTSSASASAAVKSCEYLLRCSSFVKKHFEPNLHGVFPCKRRTYG